MTPSAKPMTYPGTGRGTRGYEDFPKTQNWEGAHWLRADVVAERLNVSLIRVRVLLRTGRIRGRRAPVWYAETHSVESFRRRRDALMKLLTA